MIELDAAKVDYREVAVLMAKYFIRCQESTCLFCKNPQRNINIRRIGTQGCDGNCNYPHFTEEELIDLFVKEAAQ